MTHGLSKVSSPNTVFCSFFRKYWFSEKNFNMKIFGIKFVIKNVILIFGVRWLFLLKNAHVSPKCFKPVCNNFWPTLYIGLLYTFRCSHSEPPFFFSLQEWELNWIFWEFFCENLSCILRPWSNWTANSDKKLNVNKSYMTSRKTAFAFLKLFSFLIQTLSWFDLETYWN